MTINTFQLFEDKGIFKKIHFYYFSLLNCNIDIMRHSISIYDILIFFFKLDLLKLSIPLTYTIYVLNIYYKVKCSHINYH